jgi:hypothetical protein
VLATAGLAVATYIAIANSGGGAPQCLAWDLPAKGSSVYRADHLAHHNRPLVTENQRSDLNAARISSAKISGSSHAAKCPPLGASL